MVNLNQIGMVSRQNTLNETSYNDKTIAAMKKFRGSHAWKGTQTQRQTKLKTLNKELAKANNIKIPKLKFQMLDGTDSGHSSYNQYEHGITLRGRISVVTYLHEFAHAMGHYNEEIARHWSIGLFKQIFPISFSKLVPINDNRMYIRREHR